MAHTARVELYDNLVGLWIGDVDLINHQWLAVTNMDCGSTFHCCLFLCRGYLNRISNVYTQEVIELVASLAGSGAELSEAIMQNARQLVMNQRAFLFS
jgi:hypothetical protein